MNHSLFFLLALVLMFSSAVTAAPYDGHGGHGRPDALERALSIFKHMMAPPNTKMGECPAPEDEVETAYTSSHTGDQLFLT